MQQLGFMSGHGNDGRKSVNGGHANYSRVQMSAAPWGTDPDDAEEVSDGSASAGMLSNTARVRAVPASAQQLFLGNECRCRSLI